MLSDFINKLYLASQSLGRKGILEGQGLEVIVCPTDTDESGNWDDPGEMVHELALRKLKAFRESGKYENRKLWAIASDTVVVLNGKVIGKAKDEEEARQQLLSLSGNSHYVYSSYAVCKGDEIYSGYDRSTVVFNKIDSLIEHYLEIGEWKGAAGSYRIQNLGKQFINRIEGDVNTVIGLPLKKVENIITPKKILVHCCCGPCSTSSLKTLMNNGFEPVLYYENSNIFPEKENDLRYENLACVASLYGLKLIRGTYNHETWRQFVKGLENEPEHGKRCLKCFEFNLLGAKSKAEELGLEYFTTTLTVSRFKNSEEIFSVGRKIDGYVPFDFKKNDGFAESVRLAKDMNLYRQQYCGCEFSYGQS